MKSMKIVWKNKAKAKAKAGGVSGGVGGKKRARPLAITLNPDLPFDKGEVEPSTAAGGEADSKNINDGQEALTNDDRIRNLVESFCSQGNRLAEVAYPQIPALVDHHFVCLKQTSFRGFFML